MAAGGGGARGGTRVVLILAHPRDASELEELRGTVLAWNRYAADAKVVVVLNRAPVAPSGAWFDGLSVAAVIKDTSDSREFILLCAVFVVNTALEIDSVVDDTRILAVQDSVRPVGAVPEAAWTTDFAPLWSFSMARLECDLGLAMGKAARAYPNWETGWYATARMVTDVIESKTPIGCFGCMFAASARKLAGMHAKLAEFYRYVVHSREAAMVLERMVCPIVARAVAVPALIGNISRDPEVSARAAFTGRPPVPGWWMEKVWKHR